MALKRLVKDFSNLIHDLFSTLDSEISYFIPGLFWRLIKTRLSIPPDTKNT